MIQREHHSPFFSTGDALASVRNTLEMAETVRIATAFFEISGWRLLQDCLMGKEVRLLVGRPEPAPDRLRSVLFEFLQELGSLRGENRSRDLIRLRESLEKRELAVSLNDQGVPGILDARYLHHHAKLYMADREEVVVTSANFTFHGLRQSREAGITICDSPTVVFFVDRFDDYFCQGEDITEALLEILTLFLENRSPYEVYLRSLLEYYGLPETDAPEGLPEPATYQVPVISAILRNLEEEEGSFLVASTGLGKTIMAAHAVARLHARGLVDSVLLFCPAGLKSMWKRTLRAARVSDRVFSYHNLSSRDWMKYRNAEILLEELRYVDEKTLILLDESHHLRNESAPGEGVRLRNFRIQEAVRRGAKVLLLTATPYSRGVEDINAQLALLPSRKEEHSLIPGENGIPWIVTEPGELRDLPPVVVLTAPTVVRHFSLLDDSGNRFVIFSGDRKMYFPHRIHVKNRSYRNPMDPVLSDLFTRGLLLRREEGEPGLFELSGKRDPLLEARIVHQFCSSTGEALRVLGQLEKEGGFENIRFQNQGRLTSWVQQLEGFLDPFRNHQETAEEIHPDEKIRILLEILASHPDRKIVVFCYYHETARYLRTALNRLLTDQGVEHTLDRDGDELENLLRRFAPVANEIGSRNDPDDPQEPGVFPAKKEIRILIATGALAEGFNLQDAPVLVNFDLPWTVLVLAQRMGRILRPWWQPREVYIYNLIPSTMESLERGGFLLAGRWKERLLKRSREHSTFARIPVLVEREESLEVFQLGEAIREVGDADLELEEAMEFLETADRYASSSFLDDLATLEAEESRRLRRIPAGFRCRIRPEGRGFVYILFQWKGRPYPVVFGPGGDLDERLRAEEVFQILRRSIDWTDRVLPLEEREGEDELLDRLLNFWAESRGLPGEEVRIVCCLIATP